MFQFIPLLILRVFSLLDAAILDECDVIFFATPHGVAMEGAGVFIKKGIKAIDLGADFRLNDKAEYQQWYELEHTQDDKYHIALI
jgi:N-acetyl-gamma-glutamyl-phosphate reductase